MRKFVIEFDGYTPKTIEPIEQALAEAFQNGLHVGESKCEHCDEYKRGLDDAWEMAKRIVLTKTDANCPYFTVVELEKIFGCSSSHSVFDTYSASDAIEKVKAYEEHQKVDDEIKVGDEVMLKSNDSNCLGVVVRVDDTNAILMTRDGYTTMYLLEILKKTDCHFPQVAELLKAMNGEQRRCSNCKHQLVNSIECVDCCGYEKWEPKEGAE